MKQPPVKTVTTTLAQALRFADEHGGKRRFSVATLLCVFLILVAVSFTMLWLGDKLNASGMALTRFMASGQAPVTAQFGYPGTGRDQIAVFLYDQQFLRETGTPWPLSYQDHADWLLRLAGTPSARPKAIFLDITFGQERRDPTLPALAQALCTLRNEHRVPVFIAALPSPVDGKLAARPGLGQDGVCFTLVGVDYTPDPIDRFAWAYPLTRHFTRQGWVDGPANAASTPSHRSAAMSIAQDVAHIDLGEETVAMALAWGHDGPAAKPLSEEFAGCVSTRAWKDNLVPGVFRQLYETDRPPLCPYHRTLSMAMAGEMSEHDLAAQVKDRYVMVGARIPGYNDFVTSPVHDLLPGVYYHAMALDNLLSYEGDYKLNHEWNARGLAMLSRPGLLAIATVLLVRWLFMLLSARVLAGPGKRFLDRLWSRGARRAGLGSRPGQTLPCDWIRMLVLWALAPAAARLDRSRGHARRRRSFLLPHLKAMQRRLRAGARQRAQSWYDRLVLSAAGALGWAARLLLQFVAAMAMIALLQSLFRVGMLPVVELVGMTLLAEGFNHLGKLRWFFLGDDRPDARRA